MNKEWSSLNKDMQVQIKKKDTLEPGKGTLYKLRDELMDTIRNCARMIDEDLKSKTAVYLSIAAPRIFGTVKEMNEYFSNKKNAESMSPGHGILVKNSEHDFYWGKDGKPHECNYKIKDSDFVEDLKEEDKVNYKLAFCVDDREVCSAGWEGIYPKYIRNSIDLANKRGRHDGENIYTLSYEQYIDYRIVEGHSDLVWGIIRRICEVCSSYENIEYTTKEKYGNVVYDNYYEGKGSTNNDE